MKAEAAPAWTPLSGPVEALAARRAALAASREGEPAWLAERRAAAWERFAARGLPSTRDEAWKWTSLAAVERILAAAAVPTPRGGRGAAAIAAERGLRLHGGVTLVFVDGTFEPSLSGGPALPDSVRVGSIAAALRREPTLLERALATVAHGGDRPFCDLSTALFDDGALVHIGRDTCLPVPIEILHVTSGGAGGRPVVAFPRTLVIAEPETRVTLVEHHVAAGEGLYLTVPVTEVALDRNAAVEHVLWQEDSDDGHHVAALEARQERDSRFVAHALTIGGALVRTDTGVSLAGEGAEVALHGLTVVFATRHAEHRTRIVHACPRGTSRQAYKGIVDGHGTSAFQGKVTVRPGAKKTSAKQTNHNLLLSRDAVAETKPELEIDENDVKCAHGATVGRLDETALFYLRSRGIAEQDARDLLVRAFARDVTDRISIEGVRTRIERWMTERLPALAGRGGGS